MSKPCPKILTSLPCPRYFLLSQISGLSWLTIRYLIHASENMKIRATIWIFKRPISDLFANFFWPFSNIVEKTVFKTYLGKTWAKRTIFYKILKFIWANNRSWSNFTFFDLATLDDMSREEPELIVSSEEGEVVSDYIYHDWNFSD